jgi:hypothetical protein
MDGSICRAGCTGRYQQRLGVARVSSVTEVRELPRHSLGGHLQWHLAWEANSYPPAQENRSEQKALSLVMRLRKLKPKASFCQFVRMKQLVSCWMHFYYKLRQHSLLVTWSSGGYFKNSCYTLTNYNVCRIWRLLINTGEESFGIDFVCHISTLHRRSKFWYSCNQKCPNQHQFSEENPRGKIHTMHQQQCWISVRAGTVGDCLAGPHALPQRLTGSVHRDFILNYLQQLLQNVLFAVRVHGKVPSILVDHSEMYALMPNTRNG